MPAFSPRGYKNPATTGEINDPAFWKTVGENQDARWLEIAERITAINDAGNAVRTISIVDGDLIVTRVDGTTENLGKVEGDPLSPEDAAALIEDQGLVRNTDEGIPFSANLDDYDEVVLNDQNLIARGIRKDGTNHLPKAEVGGLTHVRMDIPGYAFALVNDGGAVSELAVGADGNIVQEVLDRWAQRMGAATGSKLPPLAVVVAGQSNATRRGVTTEAALGEATQGVYRYEPSTGAIIPETGVHWLGSGFGREVVRRNPGRTIILVEAAVGGTGFWTTSLDPAPAGYSTTAGTWDRNFEANTGQVDPVNYPELFFEQRVPEALAAAHAFAGVEPELLCLIWSQGESDATDSRPASEYEARMDDLFTWARTLWGTPDLPILVGSQTPNRIAVSPAQADIDAVHMDTPRRLTRTAYQRGPSDMEENTANRTHYLPLGQEQRGEVLAGRVLERARQNADPVDTTTSIMPPQRFTLRRFGDQVTATWEHPPCRITGITMETSTDGTTWAPATLSHPMAIEHTLAQAAPVRVRLTTTNGAATSYPAEEAI